MNRHFIFEREPVGFGYKSLWEEAETATRARSAAANGVLRRAGVTTLTWVKGKTTTLIHSAVVQSPTLRPFIAAKLKTVTAPKAFVFSGSDAEFNAKYLKLHKIVIPFGSKEEKDLNNIRGFYHRPTDSIHLRPSTNVGQALRLLISRISAPAFRSFFGQQLDDELSVYFTNRVLMEQGLAPLTPASSNDQLRCATELLGVVSLKLIGQGYFQDPPVLVRHLTTNLGIGQIRSEDLAGGALCRSQLLRQAVRPTSGCGVFLPSNPGNWETYVVPPTTGRMTLMINGRNSGGPGPDDNVAEAFTSMQKAVEPLKPKETLYLAAWHFDPSVPLTVPGPAGVKTWGELFQRKAREGVKIRIIMTDFAPIAKGLYAKLHKEFLPALNKLIEKLPSAARDNLKYIVSRHPATQFRVHVATHHQKFMIVKSRGATTAFCGGLDIAYMRTPYYWKAPNYPWLWHDIHTKLEGRITRDLEAEFVLRWNREKSSSVVPAQKGWKAYEDLVRSQSGVLDLKADKNTQRLQMHRTVTVQGVGSNIQIIKRDDIWQGYLQLIACARRFIYLENQYFREPRMADAIVRQAKAHPALIVIIVVPEQLDDPNDAIKRHGNSLQYEFFRRLLAGLGSNQLRVYTMFNRIIHSKLILVDDNALSVGSANANPRGFFLDTELNVMLDDAETVKRFRHRLWAHNLGVPQSAVAGWATAHFIPRWDAVAKANEGRKKTPNEVTGEGVIPFDTTLEKGQKEPLIQDVLTELNRWRREPLGYR